MVSEWDINLSSIGKESKVMGRFRKKVSKVVETLTVVAIATSGVCGLACLAEKMRHVGIIGIILLGVSAGVVIAACLVVVMHWFRSEAEKVVS